MIPKFAFKKGCIPWNKGKKMSEEWCERARVKSIGNKYHLGCHHSEAVKLKLSQNKERARKISEALKGRKKSKEHRQRLSEVWKGVFVNEKHPNWKGNDVGYRGIHHWIQSKLGKARRCEFCGKEGIGREIHWANKDHKYARSLTDWISLCIFCHCAYDKNRRENPLKTLT